MRQPAPIPRHLRRGEVQRHHHRPSRDDRVELVLSTRVVCTSNQSYHVSRVADFQSLGHRQCWSASLLSLISSLFVYFIYSRTMGNKLKLLQNLPQHQFVLVFIQRDFHFALSFDSIVVLTNPLEWTFMPTTNHDGAKNSNLRLRERVDESRGSWSNKVLCWDPRKRQREEQGDYQERA